MESKKAKEYISTHIRCAGDIAEEEQVILDLDAEAVAEIAEQEMRKKAVDVFEEFMDYCEESGKREISESREHYIGIFKQLLNRKQS